MNTYQFARTRLTFGKDKVDVAEERIHDINPDCRVTKWKTFYMPETAGMMIAAEVLKDLTQFHVTDLFKE